MILAIDVAYSDRTAWAAGVLFLAWDSDALERELIVRIEGVADYVPGHFYRRELPCILRLLSEIRYCPGR